MIPPEHSAPAMWLGIGSADSRRRVVRLRALGPFAVVLVLSLGASLAASASALAAEAPETRSPEHVTATSALLKGLVNPSGEAAKAGTYRFLYKANPKVVSTKECETGASATPGGGYSAERQGVEEGVTGLLANTEYVFCLVAKDAGGEAVGSAESFVTAPEASETGNPTEITANSARLQGALEPPGTKLRYHFNYNLGASCTGGSVSPEGEGEGAVTAVVEGLTPGSKYTFCLVARNAGGETVGQGKSFETLADPPAVEGESVSQVTAKSAHLEAELRSRGLPTTYHFEYGPTTAYGQSAPVPDASVGPAFAGVLPGLLVEGLAPVTTYHYRLVARNSLGTTDGPDMTFVTQGGELAGLLDGRMWELVSPADKHGTALEAITEEGGVIQAAGDGSGLAYIAKGPIQSNVEGNRSIADSQLLAKRENGVWATRDISSPHENPAGYETGNLSEYRFFSNDLSAGFLVPAGATPLTPQATEPTPYLRETPSGAYVPLVYSGNVPAGTKFGGTEIIGSEDFSGRVEILAVSPNGRHAILSSMVPLTPGLVNNGLTSLYEWTAGTITLISVIPSSPATTCGGSGPACVSTAEAGVDAENRQLRGVVSDGNRVTFITVTGITGSGSMYVRDVARGETVQIDVPQPGATGEGGHAVPQLASSDGSRVFFTDQSRLTTDATAKEEQRDLYMCTVEVVGGHLSCALKDLTVDSNSGDTAAVRGGVIGVSGQYVYFVANGALAPGAVHGECPKSAKTREPSAAISCNLYVYDLLTEKARLVAVLSARDGNDWGSYEEGRELGALTSRVSPNGRWLAFMSRRPLTGFDNRDARTGELDEEVFLYDSTSRALRCVSCAATGARPVGVFDEGEFPGLLVDRPQLWGAQGLAGSIPGWTRSTKEDAPYQARYLSDEGRLFFNSPVGLVPGDSNGKEDVYEFEPDGVGGCTLPSGCQALISSGASADESAFLDASATGEDVFFLTAAKLVGPDTDTALDVYDAHVCSVAVPCPSGAVSVPPACTTADSCRAAPAPQPSIFGAPASATFGGAGNAALPLVRPAVRTLTRAQKLARALKACRRKHDKHKRGVCERQARHVYGPLHKNKRARTNGRPHR